MKKRDTKQIRRIAESLPVMFEPDPNRRQILCSWKDVPIGWKRLYHQKSGTKGMKVEECPDPNRAKWLVPRLITVNHYRRVKRIYEDGGAEAVMEYIRKVRREYPEHQRMLMQLI